MKRRIFFLSFALLTVLFSVQTTVWAEKRTVTALVYGKWERGGLTEKIHLYRMNNGTLEELTSTVIANDSTFVFTCKPGAGDFFYIGKNKLPENRYAFFLKPGDVLDFTVNDSTYLLNGNNNSPENKAMTRWHDFVLEMEAQSVYFMKNHSNYVDFFPLLEQKLKDLENYPKNPTNNSEFYNAFEKYTNLNLLDIAISYLFKPRTAHPSAKDFPDYYRNLDLADLTKTTDLLKYPEGVGLIDKVLVCKRSWIEKTTVNQAEGFLSEINTIPNDTIKGEFILYYAPRQKTYIGLADFEVKYGKYLITDNQKIRMRTLKNALTPAKENTPAIDFSFPDINGNEVSLSGLKGKAVYIDFWATWCGPCIKEIPALQKLEADYHGKDIVFLSISIDALKDKKKWETFVTSREMKGVQLFAGDEGSKELAKTYKISGIPRFVLVGKDGSIVSSDAPRPSSSEIRPLLNSLLK